MKKTPKEDYELLYESLLQLKSVEECRKFMEDLCTVTELKVVWDISDTLNGLMAIPNLIGILLLSPVVIKLTKEHFNGVKAGKLE